MADLQERPHVMCFQETVPLAWPLQMRNVTCLLVSRDDLHNCFHGLRPMSALKSVHILWSNCQLSSPYSAATFIWKSEFWSICLQFSLLSALYPVPHPSGLGLWKSRPLILALIISIWPQGVLCCTYHQNFKVVPTLLSYVFFISTLDEAFLSDGAHHQIEKVPLGSSSIYPSPSYLLYYTLWARSLSWKIYLDITIALWGRCCCSYMGGASYCEDSNSGIAQTERKNLYQSVWPRLPTSQHRHKSVRWGRSLGGRRGVPRIRAQCRG